MACTCAPALIVARNELNALFPARDKSSDGCCGDAAHAARKSDHNPNLEGYARAYDFDEDIANFMGDQELWAMGLLLLDDKRTKYLIYEGRILYPDGTNRAYTGINAHTHHLHLSIHDWAVLDKTPWRLDRAFKAAPSPEPKKEAGKVLYIVRAENEFDHYLTDRIQRRKLTKEGLARELVEASFHPERYHAGGQTQVWPKAAVEEIPLATAR